MADEDFTLPLKTCKKCNQAKLRAEFFKSSGCKDGLRGECKSCTSSQQAQYYEANKEKINAACAAWYATNSERSKATGLAWSRANPEKSREAKRKWAKANPEKIRAKNVIHYKNNSVRLIAAGRAWEIANRDKSNASNTAWRKNNPERYKAAYTAQRKNNPELYKAIAAAYRKRNPETVRIRDHARRAIGKQSSSQAKGLIDRLVKLQRGLCPCCNLPLGDDFHMDHIIPLSRGGSIDGSNIQLMRAICNMQKSAKDPIDYMQSKGFLI